MPESPEQKLRLPPEPPPETFAPSQLPYAELEVMTNFSFLQGASHADELVLQASRLGHHAIAVTDLNSLAGAVRMHDAARQIAKTGWSPKLIIGARLAFEDAPDVLVWAPDRQAYANLCRLLTLGRRRAPKGECKLYLNDLLEGGDGLLAALIDHSSANDSVQPPPHILPSLKDAFGKRLSLVITRGFNGDDETRIGDLLALARRFNIAPLATNAVHYHVPERRPLQDILTCIRHGCTIHDAGYRLFANGERYLKSPEQMHRLFAEIPQALNRSIEIAGQCTFSLDELRYEYPDEIVPAGKSAIEYLTELTWTGASERYPHDIPAKVRDLILKELDFIQKMKFEAYFLTVYDIVKYARSQGILCQGRGSAANSAVCYCLGVTSVDPAKIDVLFERFLSSARGEPPDIDIDFEHERREEVIQYVYNKYGRDRAGMTATVITYRGRSAVRDVGKALGLGVDVVDQLAKRLDWWHRGTLDDQQIKESGVDPTDPTIRALINLTTELLGFPRHLSQHTGGMVMTRGSLCEMVPIENASMDNRTVIEWDKNDIDALGMLKVDVLALGMLTVISKAFKLLEESDEATKRRSDGGEEGKEKDDNGSNVPGLDRMAERYGAGKNGVRGNAADAGERTIWTDEPNSSCRGIHSFQYCGGSRTTEPPGLSEVLTNCAGIACRVDDADRTGTEPENGCAKSTIANTPGGGGSYPSRPDSQFGTEEQREAVGPPPPLRRFVASSLPRSSSSELSLRRSSSRYAIHTLPSEDPSVYDMICDADTVGVFQIESRAQMSMLPRLRPRRFYDLVIEVAIVRPGPIQGNMVHPYLQRRELVRSGRGHEIAYESEALRQTLGHTLGVPLFQEQAMRVVMVAAGFSAEDADKLRRAMAAWRKNGAIDGFYPKVIRGMLERGYTREFAERVFEQIRGFGQYGFPESHAASFAILVYASAWIKRHHPAVFCAALLNSQPMGFYAPAQIVIDAKNHGVEVRPVDVNESEWDCILEERHEGTEALRHEGEEEKSKWGLDGPAVRLGFRRIKGLRQDHAEAIVNARHRYGLFTSIEEFHRITELPATTVRRLAEADAFGSVGHSRRPAVWNTLPLRDEKAPLFDSPPPVPSSLPCSVPPCLRASVPSCLPPMPLGQEVMTDYATGGLSLKAHPLSLIRDQLKSRRIITASELSKLDRGWVRVAGLVLIRQRPGTASGIVFETIEDETGVVNLIIRPDIYEKHRPAARHAGLLECHGYVERQGKVIHVMAKRMFDLSHLLAGYELSSRDFH
jgi:error-prone DNA polymerase